MNLRSYAGKIWILIAAWVLAILVIFGGILAKSTHDFYYGYTAEENEELRETASGLAVYIASLSNESKAQAQFVFLSNILKYDLLATDMTGKVVLSTNRLRNWNQAIMPSSDMQVLKIGQDLTYEGNIPQLPKRVLKVAVPVIKNGLMTGAVFVIEPLTYVEVVKYSVTHSIQWGLSLSFLLALPLGLYLAQRIARPVIEMDEAIKDIVTGNYARPIPLNSTAELASLGQSVNTLSMEIRHQLAQIDYERQQLANILISIEDGVITVSPQGKILIANRVALELFAPTHESMMINMQDLPGEMQSFLSRTLRVPQLQEGEFKHNGEVYKVGVSPLLANEEYAGLVAVWHNVTKERRLEALRREFVQNVSHELRTPLSYLQGYSEALLDGMIKDDAQRHRYLETILNETLRLRRLVDDLLDLNRIEFGGIELPHEEVSVPDTLDRLKHQVEPLASQKQVRLILECTPNLPAVDCSPDRLLQILLNLVDNALHFTPGGSEIKITANQSGQRVQITVTDQGPGISLEEQNLVWNRFERGRHKNRPNGTGLGLAIVKSLVEGYHGEVRLVSEVGKGSTFSVYLPGFF